MSNQAECGCRYGSLDGLGAGVSWACRRHWWREFGGVYGGALMLFVFFAVFWLLLT